LTRSGIARAGVEDYMTVDQLVLEKLRSLPPEKQEAVLKFVESLEPPSSHRNGPRRLRGLCSDLGIHIGDEDIAQARQEMWGTFPREDV
jgi:hypothetical protein